MMRTLLRKSKISQIPKETELPEPVNDTNDKTSAYVEALQHLQDNQYNPINDPSDPLAVALDEMHDHLIKNSQSALANMVELSMQSSEALAAISFVTGDVREAADSTQAIAAAIEELSASSNDISKSSHNVVENSHATQEAITTGKAAVENSVESIDLIAQSMDTANQRIQTLSESVQAIVEILGTIENIAKQTNLLALNATIEAARAGEAGKGFAVVATEVKTLAGQTAIATEDIREKINAISEGMDNVSEAMTESVGATDVGRSNIHKAGEEIEQVVSNVQTTTELMATVASSVTEQDAAIREIAQSIEIISEKTEKAAKNADHSSDVTVQTAQVVDQQLLEYQKMDIPNSVLEFARSDHILWKKKLASMLVGKDSLTADELADHHHCRLGTWYYSVEDEKIKKHPAYIKLEGPHAKVHEHGKKCAELFGKGDREGASAQYELMSEASKDVLSLLAEIKASIVK